MNSRTHENFAKLLYPKMTYKNIQRVNAIIDNPSKKSKLFADTLNFVGTMERDRHGKMKKKYNNRLDFFGLGNIPHRRVNHDPVSATIMSLLEYGPDAIPLTNLHLVLDAISENMKRQVGVSGRNLVEAQMNFVLEQMVRRKTGNRPSFL